MINTSDAWKEYAKNNFIYHIKAVLTPSSGSALNLTDEDFMMGSVRFNDSTSDSDTFTIGGVITNTFEGTLNNTEGKFDNFNFDGATISVQVGIEYEDSTSEYINRGVYTVDKPSTMGSTIQLTCYDYMDKLNVYYIGQQQNGTTITFPIQAQTLAQYLCEYCGVTWGSWSLGSFTVNEFEYDESTTCRQVLGWILQCVGGFAKMSPTGTIQCKWYDAKFWSNAINMDGGVFNPWQTAGNLDGGTMWVAVPTYSGGTMLDGASWEFTQVSRINVGVVDIEITGVRAYAYGTVDEFEFETVGDSGYIIALSDNPLITSSNMQTVATNVYNQCQGLHFRIFDASVWASPNMEAGDSCLIQDYRGKVYPSIVTNMNYKLNGLCDVECNAETPGENSMEVANPQTQTITVATRATYDYIAAKKISADYISAGTIEASVVAKDFKLEGGSIKIETTDENTDWINLSLDSGTGSYVSNTSPTLVGITADQDYYADFTGNRIVRAGLEVGRWNGQTQVPVLTADALGNVYINGTGTARFSGSVTASSFVNSSRIDLKKNLTKIDSVLDKIKSADILSFNFKDEAEDKKHIGLAIGGDYNAPEEVVAKDEDGEEQGVDLYSMVSMAWKAIQEQQEIIESLEARVEALEKKLNPFGKITDIIKGDTDGNTN